MAEGPSIRIGGETYDVNRDFSWRELLTVEELSGVPLARDGSLDHFVVLAAFVFVIRKRVDESLAWEGFLDGNISDLLADQEDEPAAAGAKKPAAKRRPTKPSA